MDGWVEAIKETELIKFENIKIAVEIIKPVSWGA